MKVSLTPPAADAPAIRALRRDACVKLLVRHAVGRMAYSFHDRVNITPMHYVFADGWIYARTSRGEKMTTIRHSPWVAFEVDEVDGIFDWRSVVALGTVYAMEPRGSRMDLARWSRGVEQLRRLIPETASEADPVPFRTIVFGIHVDSLTGRVSSSRRRALRQPASG